MKHQKAPGWQRICYGLFCAALNPDGRQIISFTIKVPKFRHSSSAEAAAKVEVSQNQNNNSQGDVTEKEIIVHRQKKVPITGNNDFIYGNSDFR